MSEEVKSISRRSAFSLLGLTATLGFAVPTVLTVLDAEAQTAGMERRRSGAPVAPTTSGAAHRSPRAASGTARG